MLVTEISPNDELWLSKVEAPQIITDANLFAWDDEADLVIAGLGGAGIAAANEALDQGLQFFPHELMARYLPVHQSCHKKSKHSEEIQRFQIHY